MPRIVTAAVLLLLGVIPRAAAQSPEDVGASTATAKSQELAAALFPPTTAYYSELTDPPKLFSLIFDHPLRARIEALPPYQAAIQSPEYGKFLFGRAMVESQLKMGWREALDTMLAGGVSVAFDGETKGVVAVVRAKDAASMKLLGEKLLEFAKLGPESDTIRETEYRGISAYKVQDAFYAISEERMIITNQPDLGRGVLDRLLDGGESLNDNARFQAALEARQSGALAWAFFDVEAIRGYTAGPFKDQINNPVLELLLGGIQSALAESPYATSSLSGDFKSLSLKWSMPFKSDWIPESREYFFGRDARGRGPAVPELDETLFTLSTYRDFSELWMRAGDLFNADINDGFAQADANLSTLFAGRDFGEDILGSFQPEVVVVSSRQDFADQLPRPTLKIPAFAAVFRLKEPETMTRELRRIFQSLVGFLNVVGAMNGQNQLEMEMEKLGDDAQLVTTSFVPEPDQAKSTDAELIFNFSPSVGFVGERFVVASTSKLARTLVESKSAKPAVLADNSRMTMDADIFKQVLADNREQLIAQNMLEDGNSRDEAEAVIELILEAVGFFEGVSMRLTPSDDLLEAEFEVRVEE